MFRTFEKKRKTMHEHNWHVPPAALAALQQQPEPTDDTDRLIASVGVEWPVRVVAWSEPIDG